LSYQNSGLQAATTYSYHLIAFDGAGNRSPATGQVAATTPLATDTTAPTVPSGLAAIAVSSNRITLSWRPSTDNTGVKGYRVYRNGTSVATATGTTYLNTGLSPSTSYTYTVAAFDAAGNASAKSAGVTKSTWPPLSTRFKTGSPVKVVTTSTYVRSQAGGSILGTQAKGARGTVVGGPTYYNAMWWWKIDFSRSPDGWVDEARISQAT